VNEAMTETLRLNLRENDVNAQYLETLKNCGDWHFGHLGKRQAIVQKAMEDVATGMSRAGQELL